MTGLILCLDVEHSGPIVTENFIVAIGCAVFDAATFTKRATRLILFKQPEGRSWNAATLAWFERTPGMDQDLTRLRGGEGATIAAGMADFVEFVAEATRHVPLAEVQFVTDTASSDATWINYYLALIGHHPLHTFFATDELDWFCDVISTDSMHLGISRLTFAEMIAMRTAGAKFSQDRAARDALGIPNDVQVDVAHDHNPVNDATFIGKITWLIQQYAARPRP